LRDKAAKVMGFMEKMRLKELPTLILCIIICQAAGVVGSVFTSSSVSTWYPTLIKPSFTPPGWVIGLVWTILFTLMGISLFLIWREGQFRADVKESIYIFAAQLVVNVLWSWAFFGLHSPLAGLAVIAVLWVLILLTIVKFWPISRGAAMLLVPYILWVSFAAFLNFTIWSLNS
jgi:tryptophan-rich sensory protein